MRSLRASSVRFPDVNFSPIIRIRCTLVAVNALVLAAHTSMLSMALAQSDAECLTDFAVKSDKNLTYIASDPSDRLRAPIIETSCTNAELFREKLYVSMDTRTYDSDASLRAKLDSAKQQIEQIRQNLRSATSVAQTKAMLLGASVVVSTPWAISTTAACASAVVDGVGIAACGPAARASAGAVYAWHQLITTMSDVASIRQKANDELSKAQVVIETVQPQLDSTLAARMKTNYSPLFLGICRAVKAQCLLLREVADAAAAGNTQLQLCSLTS